MEESYLTSVAVLLQDYIKDHIRSGAQLHLSKQRATSFFGKAFSTFTDLLKYHFKLLQLF